MVWDPVFSPDGSRVVAKVERAEAVAKSLSVGPGIERTEAGPTMAAMVSDAQRDRAARLAVAWSTIGFG